MRFTSAFIRCPNHLTVTSLNTDFAETEVDNRQINLTRFPLFFPEKRAFFLENAGVFSFSNTSPEIIPFFSRRIGLLEGNEVPLRAGTKLTGKENQTFARLPEGNFVARVISLRADYSVSPLLTFFNLVQFDNESKSPGWQSRVRWILKPGNEVFIVFNQGWLQDERGGLHFRATDTKLAAKMQYTFRF